MLQKDMDLTAFFDAVNRCRGEVFFLSSEGDRLSLKSSLCQYLFTCVYLNKAYLLKGSIQCSFAEDMESLAPFLEP